MRLIRTPDGKIDINISKIKTIELVDGNTLISIAGRKEPIRIDGDRRHDVIKFITSGAVVLYLKTNTLEYRR